MTARPRPQGGHRPRRPLPAAVQPSRVTRINLEARWIRIKPGEVAHAATDLDSLTRSVARALWDRVRSRATNRAERAHLLNWASQHAPAIAADLWDDAVVIREARERRYAREREEFYARRR